MQKKKALNNVLFILHLNMSIKLVLLSKKKNHNEKVFSVTMFGFEI